MIALGEIVPSGIDSGEVVPQSAEVMDEAESLAMERRIK